MHESLLIDTVPRERHDAVRAPVDAELPPPRAALPSWLVSLIVHMLLLIALGTLFHLAPRGGTIRLDRMLGLSLDPVERGEEHGGGNDVKAGDPSGGDASQSNNSQNATSGGGGGPGDAAGVLPSEAPFDPSDALPTGLHMAGGGLGGGGVPGVGGMTAGGQFGTGPRKGAASTGVFGVQGEGFKFVYVFDRSGSMGGTGRTPLQAAKDELIASLESLDDIHQFQIVFYNELPTMFPLAGQMGRLVFGTSENKDRARQFVASISADGATRHEDALEMALRLQPDVIFFLTDADQPILTAAQLANIRQRNGGRTSINTIEFGLGPAFGGRNFLIDLAAQNGGKHVYVDVARLKQ